MICRWSAIAARLPGRTDNEIKNVWHTHLKKRLPQNQQPNNETLKQIKKQSKLEFDVDAKQEQCSSDISSSHNNNSNSNNSISSSVVTTNNHDNSNNNDDDDSAENKFAMDEDFWSEVLSSDKSSNMNIGAENYEFQVGDEGVFSSSSLSLCQDMDFWHDVYARAEEITELLEL